MNIPKEKKWYAVYTKSRTEKKVEEALKEKNIEVYLPLQKVLKQWSDRKKWVTEPVIRSYIFVCVNNEDFRKVTFTPGVSRYVTFEGKPVPIPDDQINHLRLLIDNDIPLEVTREHFEKGEEVEVEFGSLKGLRGTLIDFRGKHKVMIRIQGLDQILMFNLPLSHLKKLKISVNG